MWGENNILITDENSVEKLKLPGLTMLVEVQVYSYNPKCVCVCVCVYVCVWGEGGVADIY
jgi:hypothetical protein